MKFFLIHVLGFVLMSPVHATDFRGTALGGNCSDIEAAETVLGSVPEGTNGNMRNFRGLFEQWSARVAYVCSNGRLVQGVYMLEVPTLQDAIHLYEEVKTVLRRRHGQPVLDFSRPECTKDLEKNGALPPDEKYAAGWHDGGVSIDLLAVGSERFGLVKVSYARTPPSDANFRCVD